MKTIATFLTLDEAYLARMELEAAGVKCFIADESIAGSFPTEGYYAGVRLQVPEEQEDAARRALKDFLAVKRMPGKSAVPEASAAPLREPILRNFRILVILDAFLVIFWHLYSLPRELSHPPDHIAEYLDRWTYSQSLADLSAELWRWNHAAALLSAIGLFFFFKPARSLYVLTWIAYLCIVPFFAAGVSTGFANLMGVFQMLLGGFLLALMYYSPVAREFTDEPWARGKKTVNSAKSAT